MAVVVQWTCLFSVNVTVQLPLLFGFDLCNNILISECSGIGKFAGSDFSELNLMWLS